MLCLKCLSVNELETTNQSHSLDGQLSATWNIASSRYCVHCTHIASMSLFFSS